MGKTLSDLILGARRRAGMENDQTCSDEEWEEYVNQGNEAFYEKLVLVAGSEHFAKPRTINLTAGVQEYELPPDFFSLLNVDYEDSRKRRPMKMWDLQTEYQYTQPSGLKPRAAYRCIEHTLHIRGEFSTGHKVHYWYVQKTPALTDAEEVYNVNGWDKWIEIDAAQTALIKEGSTEEAMALNQGKLEVEQRIARLGPNKDMEPYEIVDDQGDSEYFEWYLM